MLKIAVLFLLLNPVQILAAETKQESPGFNLPHMLALHDCAVFVSSKGAAVGDGEGCAQFEGAKFDEEAKHYRFLPENVAKGLSFRANNDNFFGIVTKDEHLHIFPRKAWHKTKSPAPAHLPGVKYVQVNFLDFYAFLGNEFYYGSWREGKTVIDPEVRATFPSEDLQQVSVDGRSKYFLSKSGRLFEKHRKPALAEVEGLRAKRIVVLEDDVGFLLLDPKGAIQTDFVRNYDKRLLKKFEHLTLSDFDATREYLVGIDTAGKVYFAGTCLRCAKEPARLAGEGLQPLDVAPASNVTLSVSGEMLLVQHSRNTFSIFRANKEGIYDAKAQFVDLDADTHTPPE